MYNGGFVGKVTGIAVRNPHQPSMGRLMWFWTLYWISIKGVAFRGTLQFMILHVRECNTEYFFPMVSWIQPISSCLPRQDDGHPVVDHSNIVRRSAGKNREYWQIIFKAVDVLYYFITYSILQFRLFIVPCSYRKGVGPMIM